MSETTQARNDKTVETLRWLGHVIANYMAGDWDHHAIADELRFQTYAGLSDDFGDKARHLDTVAGLAAFHKAIGAQVTESVSLARKAGATWDEVGVVFNITRQAAQQRFGDAR